MIDGLLAFTATNNYTVMRRGMDSRTISLAHDTGFPGSRPNIKT